MSRAADTGVVSPDQHLAEPPEFVLVTIMVIGYQGLQIILDTGMILIGGDNHINDNNTTGGIIGIVVSKQTRQMVISSL